MVVPPRGFPVPGGFTLIEVLVALAIVAIALLAGLKASAALSSKAQRQADGLRARVCAENELVRLRLLRQLPPVGESCFACVQARRDFQGVLLVQATPNRNFRRVDAQVRDGSHTLLRLVTIVGSFQ